MCIEPIHITMWFGSESKLDRQLNAWANPEGHMTILKMDGSCTAETKAHGSFTKSGHREIVAIVTLFLYIEETQTPFSFFSLL